MPESEQRLFRWQVRPFFRWYDLWIGAYLQVKESDAKAIYICPLPMIGIKIEWWWETLESTAQRHGGRQALDYIAELVKQGKSYEEALERARKIFE